ncbi:hypothetical protein FNF28_06725 [Cafeteria roenbergensis]|uniref:EF-hand domain-containing protein n=1 Tax=Cafeteria roenbergensis TaxID=33653 RepID=A0A5A8CT02_CAFRO|nr:hypothetical protein FNF28_06725 [Cafeteria roenbergensis]
MAAMPRLTEIDGASDEETDPAPPIITESAPREWREAVRAATDAACNSLDALLPRDAWTSQVERMAAIAALSGRQPRRSPKTVMGVWPQVVNESLLTNLCRLPAQSKELVAAARQAQMERPRVVPTHTPSRAVEATAPRFAVVVARVFDFEDYWRGPAHERVRDQAVADRVARQHAAVAAAAAWRGAALFSMSSSLGGSAARIVEWLASPDGLAASFAAAVAIMASPEGVVRGASPCGSASAAFGRFGHDDGGGAGFSRRMSAAGQQALLSAPTSGGASTLAGPSGALTTGRGGCVSLPEETSNLVLGPLFDASVVLSPALSSLPEDVSLSQAQCDEFLRGLRGIARADCKGRPDAPDGETSPDLLTLAGRPGDSAARGASVVLSANGDTLVGPTVISSSSVLAFGSAASSGTELRHSAGSGSAAGARAEALSPEDRGVEGQSRPPADPEAGPAVTLLQILRWWSPQLDGNDDAALRVKLLHIFRKPLPPTPEASAAVVARGRGRSTTKHGAAASASFDTPEERSEALRRLRRVADGRVVEHVVEALTAMRDGAMSHLVTGTAFRGNASGLLRSRLSIRSGRQSLLGMRAPMSAGFGSAPASPLHRPRSSTVQSADHATDGGEVVFPALHSLLRQAADANCGRGHHGAGHLPLSPSSPGAGFRLGSSSPGARAGTGGGAGLLSGLGRAGAAITGGAGLPHAALGSSASSIEGAAMAAASSALCNSPSAPARGANFGRPGREPSLTGSPVGPGGLGLSGGFASGVLLSPPPRARLSGGSFASSASSRRSMPLPTAPTLIAGPGTVQRALSEQVGRRHRRGEDRRPPVAALLRRGDPSPSHWRNPASPMTTPLAHGPPSVSPGGQVAMLTRNVVSMSEMRPLVEALVDHHQDTAELAADETKRARYVTTVLARLVCILHGHTRCDVSASEVLDSNIADVFRVCTRRTLDHVVPFRPAEADAIAHRFDAIDRHGRGIIEFADVEAHYEGWLRAGSPYPAPFVVPLELVRRAMQGHARQLASGRTGYFCFEDWVFFELAQADSMADTSIDYWFRLLDEDGDGVLSHADVRRCFRLVGDAVRQAAHLPEDTPATQAAAAAAEAERLGSAAAGRRFTGEAALLMRVDSIVRSRRDCADAAPLPAEARARSRAASSAANSAATSDTGVEDLLAGERAPWAASPSRGGSEESGFAAAPATGGGLSSLGLRPAGERLRAGAGASVLPADFRGVAAFPSGSAAAAAAASSGAAVGSPGGHPFSDLVELHPHAMASSPPRHHGVWDETTAPPPITALFLKWARLGNQLFDAFVRLYSRHPDRTERAKDWHQRVAAHSPPLPDPADTDDDAVS